MLQLLCCVLCFCYGTDRMSFIAVCLHMLLVVDQSDTKLYRTNEHYAMGLWLCARRYHSTVKLVTVPVATLLDGLLGLVDLSQLQLHFMIVPSARLLYLASHESHSLPQWQAKLTALEQRMGVVMYPLRSVEHIFESKHTYMQYPVKLKLTSPTFVLDDLSHWHSKLEHEKLTLAATIKQQMKQELAERQWAASADHLVFKGSDGSNSNIILHAHFKVIEHARGRHKGTEHDWKAGKKELVVHSEDAHIRAIVYQIDHGVSLNQSGLLIQPFVDTLASQEFRSFYDITDPEQPVHQYTILTRTRNKKLYSASHMFGYVAASDSGVASNGVDCLCSVA